MNKILPIMPVFILLFAGCATISGHSRMYIFEDTAKAYFIAIRWSDYEAASDFLKDEQRIRAMMNIKSLDQIRVADYRVKRSDSSEDKSIVRRIVEIQYFLKDSPVIRTLDDHQIWEYDDKSSRWYLISGLPDFKF